MYLTASANKILITTAVIASTYFSSAAATEYADTVESRSEITATFSHGPYTPFWMVSNRQGLSSAKPNNGYLRESLFKHERKDTDFSWGAGADIAIPWNFTSHIVVQQLYGELRYRCLDLMVGSKEMWGPISDPQLSSGNLILSGDARPIPQIRAGIFDYADVWGLKGWLAVKGHVAYGFFTDGGWKESWVGGKGRYDKGTLYCSRGVWLRNGNPEKFPLTLECGIDLETEFGGTAYNLGRYGSGKTLKMPHDLKAFFKAFVPMHGSDNTDEAEQANVEGNMLGAWNFALTWAEPGADWNVKAYYQHMFEDHSMLYIEYPWKDGLYGIEGTLPRNPFITKAVYEFLYTKDQSGSVNWTPSAEIPGDAPGADNYYNHYIYNGWSHWGMGIGNALALSPIFNRPHTLEFLSNRVIAHHIGLSGNPLPEWSWRLLMSFTSSWGNYVSPYTDVKHAYDGLLEVCWKPTGKLKGWEYKVGLAADRGDMIGHNYGVQLSVICTEFFHIGGSKKKGGRK